MNLRKIFLPSKKKKLSKTKPGVILLPGKTGAGEPGRLPTRRHHSAAPANNHMCRIKLTSGKDQVYRDSWRSVGVDAWQPPESGT